MTALEISNDEARRLFLERHALGARHGDTLDHDDLLDIVRRIGFVQLDSVNTV